MRSKFLCFFESILGLKYYLFGLFLFDLFFKGVLLGLLGLSYGLFSSSWLEAPGSLLGFEQIGVNIQRLRNGAVARRSEQP